MFYPLENIDVSSLPKKFTYPFNYQPHPLCVEAAKSLQEKLDKWPWDSARYGKMFGVLLTKDTAGQVGFLWAYSGNITKDIPAEYFVPPIYNLLDEKSFFLAGEKELNIINQAIDDFYSSYEYLNCKQRLEEVKADANAAIEMLKQTNKAAKEERKKRRKEAEMNCADFESITRNLNRESQEQDTALRRLRKDWNLRVEKATQDFEELEGRATALKDKRHQKSLDIQQQLFAQYQLLNAKGETKGVIAIFEDFMQKMPPAAAGDCAGPRLLQYAYANDYKPLAMAEFWYGKATDTVIRKSGHFYPSCRNKCEPILGHMLQGLDVDENPILSANDAAIIEVVYEDDVLLVVNKPSGVLSVKGKTDIKSLSEMLLAQRPDIEELHTVHRLDMATSGLILLAKSESIYKTLQSQFLDRSVKKRYEALLDGVIDGENGKIELPLRVDLDNRPQQMVCEDYGKPALTIWRKLSIEEGKTRVAFFPITGRTHQLRVHAAHPRGLNTPIVGDDLYGKPQERLLLHAANLEFTHPISHKKIKVSSTIPF